jgi:hypothetical protein
VSTVLGVKDVNQLNVFPDNDRGTSVPYGHP